MFCYNYLKLIGYYSALTARERRGIVNSKIAKRLLCNLDNPDVALRWASFTSNSKVYFTNGLFSIRGQRTIVFIALTSILTTKRSTSSIFPYPKSTTFPCCANTYYLGPRVQRFLGHLYSINPSEIRISNPIVNLSYKKPQYLPIFNSYQKKPNELYIYKKLLSN